MRPAPLSRTLTTAVAACLGIALSAASASAASSSTTPAAATGRSALAGSRPAWASASALRGAAAATDSVDIRGSLGWKDQAAAAATALAVSTPGSPQYGQYLSPAQFRARFAPSQSDVTAVQQFLRDAGFSIVTTSTNNHLVAAEGTVAQAQAAFGTTLGRYAVAGQTLRAPESAVTVPAALAGVVQSVNGLDQSDRLLHATRSAGNDPKQSHGAPGVGFRAGRPCSLYFGEKTVTTPSIRAYGSTTKPLAPCGYTPAQVRGLYGLGDARTGTTGTGQTVAFVGANASPTLQQDVARYSADHNLPAPSITQLVAPGTYRHPDTPRQVPGDFYGEETLDAEAIHTTAPGAKLLFVGSSNANQDFDASINHIVDKHLANIISISYGFTGEQVPQGFVNSLNNTFIQAAATGIGVFVSSGDNGDEVTTFGTPSVDFYANSPFVTAVGGTSASIKPDSALTTLGYDAIDDPASPLNTAGWHRDFEVGWQTGLDAILVNGKPGTLTPTAPAGATAPDAKAYTLTGTLTAPLPGSFYGGGGGGTSRVFAEPGYQAAAIGQRSGRVVPDISALADPNTGFLVGQTQQFSTGVGYDEYRIGGTSLAAPLMAGMAAVANQRAGHALGFLNPRIYAAYSAGSGAYYDVDQQDRFCGGHTCTTSDPLPSVVRVNYANSEDATAGLTFSLRTLEEPAQTLRSTRGYDTATGVGTPGARFFAAITQ